MAVLICILAHNSLHLTKAAVKSALSQNYPSTVYVVDNASTDNTASWLRAQSNLEYSILHHQHSVAEAWNFMCHIAFHGNPLEAALICNNDILLRPDTITHLLADPAPFVTAVSVRSESELNYPSPPTTRRPHPDFSCFLIKPECWKKVGPFDEAFAGAYCEDSDYHVRMFRAGVEAVSIDLPFVHYGHSTIDNSNPVERRKIERAADRNRELFHSMYGCYPGDKNYEKLFVP